MGKISTGQRNMGYDGDDKLSEFDTAHVVIGDASYSSVLTVLAADESSENDGRSQWVWVRFPNGDLLLGTFPQGDTYFSTERDHI